MCAICYARRVCARSTHTHTKWALNFSLLTPDQHRIVSRALCMCIINVFMLRYSCLKRICTNKNNNNIGWGQFSRETKKCRQLVFWCSNTKTLNGVWTSAFECRKANYQYILNICPFWLSIYEQKLIYGKYRTENGWMLVIKVDIIQNAYSRQNNSNNNQSLMNINRLESIADHIHDESLQKRLCAFEFGCLCKVEAFLI